MIKEKYIPVKRRQIQLKQTVDHITLRGWLVEFSDGKGAFYNGNESNNSDSDDENYSENNEQ